MSTVFGSWNKKKTPAREREKNEATGLAGPVALALAEKTKRPLAPRHFKAAAVFAGQHAVGFVVAFEAFGGGVHA